MVRIADPAAERPGSVAALPEPVDVLGYPVRPLRISELIATLVERAARRVRTRVSYLNANTANLASDDPELAAALRSSDVLYADGISIVWAGRWLGQSLPERMTSADYFPMFAQACARRRLSMYLLGGAPGVALQAALALRRTAPDLVVAGTRDGFFADWDTERVIAEVNATRPDVLVVGMGTPRQECWLAANAARLDVPVAWSVGALLDYLAGVEPRAPRWMCAAGCEWLYRLLADPIGKWRRYLVGNPRFAWQVWRASRAAAARN